MRAVLFIVIVAVIIVIAAIASGFVNINQIRGAEAPQLAASRNGVSAQGGHPPAFDVETGSVKVGAKDTTVKVPALVVERPGRKSEAATTNNAM